ncbi:MAG TPA: CvpA family protein [Candidatus Cybelea sp.]|nr:CvpA family protein [Candidatus Cybelea sp.]
MEKFPVNLVDLAVIGLVVLSGVLAFFRGFVREVLSIAGWVGAGFAALYLYEPVAPAVRRYLSPPILANAVTAIVIFLIALIVFSVISRTIETKVRQSSMSALDRSLGFVYGVVRGVVVLALAYLLVAWAVPTDDLPQAVRTARSLPVVATAGDLLLGLLPKDARDKARQTVGSAGQQAKDAADTARALERLTRPAPEPSSKPDSGEESGYKGDERRSLDNLIRNNQGR